MTGTTTISKVIAFELGLLIAVLTWIAFAGVPGMKFRAVAEAEEPADGSFANVSPIYQTRHSRHRAPVNYPADDLQAPQTGAQSPVATVQTYDPRVTTGGYGDTIDGSGQSNDGYDQPGVEGYIVNQDPANTIGTFPEPVLDSPYDYYYSPYGQPYGYSQPVQIVILNTRGFARRNRMTHCNFPGGTMSAPRRNPRATPRVQGGRTATRPGPVATGRSVGPRSPVGTGNGNSAPRRSSPVRTTRPGQASQPRLNP